MQRTLRQFVSLAPLLLAATGWCAMAGSAFAHWHDDVGYTLLETVLGESLPTGEGIVVSQVEAAGFDNGGQDEDPNEFFPDASHADFGAASDPTDPNGQAVTFVNGTDRPNPQISNHATNVGRNFYGNSLGLAAGANTVVMYEVGYWVDSVLNGTGSTAPDAPTFAVQNHSWTGTFGSDSTNLAYLRKADYLIDENELTMVVGVSENGTAGTPHPTLHPMLGQSYNALAIGRSDGLHSTSTTSLGGYGTGRRKPSLVVGGTGINTVSGATGAVSGAAAMFHEVLAGTNGTRSETMRALLMAGATKTEFANYIDPATNQLDPWLRSPSQPLDNIFGAGELNVFNTYLMTFGGQFPGSTTSTPTPVGSYGWDYQTVSSSNDRTYRFEVPAGSTATELSIMLAWNVDVNMSFNTQTLANLSLTLRDGSGGLVDESTSGVDNHEHIYIGPGQAVTALAPGTYTLEVDTNLSRDYGLAWRMTTAFDQPSADFNEDGFVDGLDFLTWQRGTGTLLGAGHADGDADGDQDVDAADLAIFESQYGLPAPPLASVHAVPEPGTVAVSLVAVAMGLMTTRHRRQVGMAGF